MYCVTLQLCNGLTTAPSEQFSFYTFFTFKISPLWSLNIFYINNVSYTRKKWHITGICFLPEIEAVGGVSLIVVQNNNSVKTKSFVLRVVTISCITSTVHKLRRLKKDYERQNRTIEDFKRQYRTIQFCVRLYRNIQELVSLLYRSL